MSERTQALYALCREAAKAGRIVITGHDGADVDSAASCVLMQRLLAAWDIPSQILLFAPDRQAQRVMARFSVDAARLTGETDAGDSLILLDHHQAAHPGSVLACIDHHPTDNPPAYPYLQLGDSGACAVMVLHLMEEAGVYLTQEDKRLAITALYLDTIALKSAKISGEEAAWGEREAKRLGLDEGWLRREGMGLMDVTRPAHELAMMGRKVYRFGDRRVLSSYVQTDAMTQERLCAVLDVLREEMKKEQAARWIYLVHDPVRMRSTEYDLMPDGDVHVMAYGYLASRGKDVMPRVEREMMKEMRSEGKAGE
ncbi:MAG: DHH family phosphoesterase [Clostridia bacterium]|nr:DHH family phosphoesterase [Clostridia bacterium]